MPLFLHNAKHRFSHDKAHLENKRKRSTEDAEPPPSKRPRTGSGEDNSDKVSFHLSPFPFAFCICENKGTDQLRGNHVADQPLCFCCIDSRVPLCVNPKFQVGFVSDLVRNPEYRFSYDAAHLVPLKS